jgi:predicted  nucleic acid-binding Zn-ribbon protein
MKRKVALILTTTALLISCLLMGCGVAPEKYDQMAAELAKALEEIAKMRGETNDLTEEKEAVTAELQDAQAKVAELESKVSGLKELVDGLKEQYELIGATPAETAENIIRYYHETHVYSTYDLFVCGDMASDVWNMLKAQGINALITVGNKDTAVGDILDSNHAWVLAEVAPGKYLALETTGGFAIPRSENPLYYKGWYFKTPGELKSYQQLREEYNVRVGIHNEIVDEINKVIEEYNQATNQQTADKLEAVHDKLTELLEAQEAEMDKIISEINAMATKCNT